ncbi:MAG: 2OG-Fe(II) oxygenase [Phaeodactylibacter sp.]|nr:2OG-Fe(II) oxygenase [Phaeodactylibacter sp.]
MALDIGQTGQVKAGQKDEDTGTSLAGWSGRVISLDSESDLVEVEWDSPTLHQLPDAYIRHSIDEGYDYFRYHIETINIEAIEPKDTPFQTEEVQKALDAHYSDYELRDRRPLPFSAAEREAFAGEHLKKMEKVNKQLLRLLKTIKGSGSFVTSGIKDFTHPGLQLEGMGDIGLPLNRAQVKEIIKLARKAPFGKGSQTITDTAVRSAWEIDAGQLSFGNEGWQKAIQKIIKEVKKGLGIKKQSVTASLYKMLIYEPGDFFLPHKDSEKEKGMFATLVIGLPSAHTGGELIIRFDGREEAAGLSSAASNFKMPYVAFYADCEHEIKPVTSGYRVCLVYNLLQSVDAPKISSPQFQDQVGKIAEVLQSLEDSFEWRPKAVLLGHQYTPANFSLGKLKLHDRPRAEALMEAAEKAGYFASLGLATFYRMGQLEGAGHYYDYGRRSRYRYYDEEEESSGGTMGEVYEEYMTMKHWGEGGAPGLGDVPIREEDIFTELEMGEGDPIEQEEEGYTGNAGMTLQYWYHYGAIVLWPKSKHSSLLANRPVPVRLQWLEYYLQHWSDAELNPQEYARQLLASLIEDAAPEEKTYNTPDFSVVAAALARFRDESLMKQMGKALLPAVFDNINVENWVAVIQAYDPAAFHLVFQKAADTDDVTVIRHLLDVLRALNEVGSPTLAPFVLHHVQKLPEYLRKAKLQEFEIKDMGYRYLFKEEREKRKEAATAVVEDILALSSHQEQDMEWAKHMLEYIAKPLPRTYVNEVLAPILLSGAHKGRALAKALYEVCCQDFEARTAVKPTPLPDWTRKPPKTERYEHLWKILRPFLNSPTQQVFDYRQNQSYRSEMESAINSVEIDLKMQTIKKGSPHTLRLTKTQAAYERALKEWEEDVAILEQLKETGLA